MSVAAENLVEISGVGYSYDHRRTILTGIDMVIPRGKVVAIMGISGSGKTTLLRLIGGALTPTQGTVRVDGQLTHDLDRDGLLDLIIGERKGNLNYYRNTGTAAEPHFSFVTDSLGKVNVTNYNLSYDGFSTPFFFKNPLNQTLLLVGSEEGKIHNYNGIDNYLQID